MREGRVRDDVWMSVTKAVKAVKAPDRLASLTGRSKCRCSGEGGRYTRGRGMWWRVAVVVVVVVVVMDECQERRVESFKCLAARCSAAVILS